MREIKYKAWLPSLKRLVHVYAMKFTPDGNCVRVEYLDKTVHHGNWTEGVYSVYENAYDWIKLMQYTGLKDKNGTKIYEGDILDFDETEWGGKFKPEAITMGKILGDWKLSGTLKDVKEWRQVIGNIYENPELLE